MDTLLTKLIPAGAFFLAIFPSGYLLSRIGKPHNVVLVTVHKLAGVGVGVYLALSLYRLGQNGLLNPLIITVAVLTAVCFIIMVASGSLLTAERDFPKIVRGMHVIFPYLTILATVWLLIVTLNWP